MSPKATGTRKGFTLIELLMVIMIIAILIAILVPGMNPNRTTVRTRRIMQALENTLSAYHELYRMYPPSDDSSIGTGAQCLYYYLMGPREQGWGTSSADGGVPADFRWEVPGDLKQEWMIGGGPGTDQNRKFFCDGDANKDRAILYYRADVRPDKDGIRPSKYGDVYEKGDNNGPAGSPFWTPSSDEWQAMVLNPRTGTRQVPYRPTSYLLVGPGEDREFGEIGGHCDDIYNWKKLN